MSPIDPCLPGPSASPVVPTRWPACGVTVRCTTRPSRSTVRWRGLPIDRLMALSNCVVFAVSLMAWPLIAVTRSPTRSPASWAAVWVWPGQWAKPVTSTSRAVVGVPKYKMAP